MKQFEGVNRMSKAMASMSATEKVKAVKELSGQQGGLNSVLPGLQGMPGLRSKGSSYTPSIKDRFKKRRK